MTNNVWGILIIYQIYSQLISKNLDIAFEISAVLISCLCSSIQKENSKPQSQQQLKDSQPWQREEHGLACDYSLAVAP